MNLNKVTHEMLLRGEHSYLDTTDECYYIELYDDHNGGGIKPLVLSLKRGWMPAAIATAQHLASLLPSEWIRTYTFVPMPASATANRFRSTVNILPAHDIRDLVVNTRTTFSSRCGWRLTPRERQEFLLVNESVANPRPSCVVIVDDVLATGAHFRAVKCAITNRWKNIRVIGLFLARVVLSTGTGRSRLQPH